MQTDVIRERIRADILNAPDAVQAMTRAVHLLKTQMPDYTWVGIYVLDRNELVLGPFEGRPSPHTHIALGRGWSAA